MTWIEKLRRPFHGLKRTRGKISRPSFRPRIEPLEERALLSTDTWTGLGGNANWSNPANWNTGTAPAAGDDLVFSTVSSQTPTNDFAPGTIFHSLTLTGVWGATITIQGNSIVLT